LWVIGSRPRRLRKSQRRIVSAWIGTAFAEIDAPAAHAQWRSVADQLRPKVAKLASLMDAAEEDVLAFMDFPREHRAKIHSTNPIERLNGEIKRRTDAVGMFPNEAAILRLVGAILLEQSNEGATQRARYMTWRRSAPSAILAPSVCLLLHPDAATQPAQDHHFYITPGGTTRLVL
jgi:transposase-like protein